MKSVRQKQRANHGTAVRRPGRSKTRRRRNWLITGFVLIGVLIVIGVGSSLYLHSLTDLVDSGEVTGDPSVQESDLVEPAETVNETDSQSEMTEAEQEQSEAKKIAVRTDPDVYNILLIGSDRREGEKNGRSDSMIILSINKRTHKIHLASLERAIYVNIPDRGFGMLNASFSYGGSKLLRQTIEDNLRVHIDDFVMIDFSGFEAAINIVDGIDIQLTEKEAIYLNEHYSSSLTAGVNHLDGRMALAYARIRHLDSDFVRTSRQRKVIETLLKRAMSMNIGEIDAMARAILPLVKTNLSGDEIISLAVDGLEYKDYPISQMMLPIDDTYETIIVRKMQMIKFDFKENILALQAFLYDD